MTKPILNVTRSCHIARNQALARIRARVSVWVEFGKSIRDLTLGESYELCEAEKTSQPNAPIGSISNELYGLVWEPPARDKYKAIPERRQLLYQAAQILRGEIAAV